VGKATRSSQAAQAVLPVSTRVRRPSKTGVTSWEIIDWRVEGNRGKGKWESSGRKRTKRVKRGGGRRGEGWISQGETHSGPISKPVCQACIMFEIAQISSTATSCSNKMPAWHMHSCNSCVKEGATIPLFTQAPSPMTTSPGRSLLDLLSIWCSLSSLGFSLCVLSRFSHWR